MKASSQKRKNKMFEQFSDSSSHTNDCQDSFTASSSSLTGNRSQSLTSTTVSARAVMKKQQLKEMNNELIKENSLLRSQFEEAVEITAQFQDLHQKNQQLIAEIGQLQAEKEDLDHRLDISLATNKELTKRLNEEKRNHSQQNDTNINAMNNEIEKVREQAKAQLDSVLDELEKVKAQHEKDILQQKTIVGRIDRVLQSGERFFNTKLSTVDDLISFFEKPQTSNKKDAPGQNGQAKSVITFNVPGSASIDQLEKKIKHLKSKLRNAAHDKADLESQLSKAIHEVSLIKNDHNSQIAELQQKVSSLKEEKISAESLHSTKVAALEKQIEQLKQEIVSSKANGHNFIPQAQVYQQQVQQQIQGNGSGKGKGKSLPEDVEKINSLINKVDELTDNINAKDIKISDLTHQLSNAEATNSSLKVQLEKAKTQILTLTSVKEATNAEVETLRNALHTKQATAAEPIQMPKQPPNVLKYQRVIEDQKNKIIQLNQAGDKQKKLLEQREKELTLANQRLEQQIEYTRKVNDDFAEYRSKVESKKPLTVEDFLPPDAFRCPEFDSALSGCIQKIATNPSLQPITKIQSCFRAINAHLGNELKDVQASLDETTKENQFLSESFNKFIIDLSIALCDQPTTIEDFFKSNGGQKLLNTVAEFRVKFDDMKHQSDRLQEIIAHLDQSFPTGINDPVLQINEMKNQYQAQCEVVASKSSKIKRLRRELRELAQSSEAAKIESQARIDDLTAKLGNCKNSINQLEKSTSQLRSENQKLQNELREASTQLAGGEEIYKQRETDAIGKVLAEHNDKYSELHNQYLSLESQYSDLVDDFNNQSQRISELEGKVDSQKRAIASKDREIHEFNHLLASKEEETNQRIESEKKLLSDTFKNAIDELTQQCAKHRSDVERMAKVVADNEKQMSIIKNENNILKKQKIKTDNEMKMLVAKVNRERKLIESNATAKRIAYESEMNQKLNEEKQKYEQDKRRICRFGAESFKMFYNATSSIDEKSFKNVIECARDELTRLMKSDAAVRRIVAARDNQTTEDAVAQVLMHSL